MTTIKILQQKSGAQKFASILGKSTIDSTSEEYKTIEKITEIVLQNDYGVIHGGYAGGAMSAVSDTANTFIKNNKKSPFLNIGIPQKQHDGLWERVSGASFIDTSENIYDRIKYVTSGDIAIICPLGGDGTELEETIVFHENVVKESMNKYGNYTEKMTPLIFVQTPNGTNWKKLIETKLQILCTSTKNIEEYSWLYFVNSIEEFEEVLKKI